VIINGVNTKYLANNKLQSVKQTFFRADANNKTPLVNRGLPLLLNPVQFGRNDTTKRRTLQLLDVAIKQEDTCTYYNELKTANQADFKSIFYHDKQNTYS
jgi:hypothetical protein